LVESCDVTCDGEIGQSYRLRPEYEKISTSAKFHHAFGSLKSGLLEKRAISNESVEKVFFAEKYFLIFCL